MFVTYSVTYILHTVYYIRVSSYVTYGMLHTACNIPYDTHVTYACCRYSVLQLSFTDKAKKKLQQTFSEKVFRHNLTSDNFHELKLSILNSNIISILVNENDKTFAYPIFAFMKQILEHIAEYVLKYFGQFMVLSESSFRFNF